MAQAGVTMTGVTEVRRAIERLPADVTAALRARAWRSSRSIMTGAKQRLLARYRAPKTADSIAVIEEADRRQFVVIVAGDPARPRNLPLWLEAGTIHMSGAHYMRGATEAESPNYIREAEAVAVAVVQKALT